MLSEMTETYEYMNLCSIDRYSIENGFEDWWENWSYTNDTLKDTGSKRQKLQLYVHLTLPSPRRYPKCSFIARLLCKIRINIFHETT